MTHEYQHFLETETQSRTKSLMTDQTRWMNNKVAEFLKAKPSVIRDERPLRGQKATTISGSSASGQ